jgi:isocitrate lyase
MTRYTAERVVSDRAVFNVNFEVAEDTAQNAYRLVVRTE